MDKKLQAIVTAGGTREKIDDVRVVTNLSGGRFGAAIARALARRDVGTTLIGSRELRRTPEGGDPALGVMGFDDYESLWFSLQAGIALKKPDLIFMAAAVSDFSPIRQEGKISSDQEELVVRMRRNPKILASLRKLCGVGTFLVGFKLTSGASRQEMLEAARKQIKACRLNLVVANDLANLEPDRHVVTLVTPEGGAIDMAGTKDEVAEHLVEFVLRRRNVRWARSVPANDLSWAPYQSPGGVESGRLLRFAQDANLLTGTDGNVSNRHGHIDLQGLWVTPRQVDKSKIGRGDLLLATPSPDGFEVRYQGKGKPSIDTSVHVWLYRQMPELCSMAHFHHALVLEDASTSFPYPCGCREEAEEILAALSRAATEGRLDPNGGFAVKMSDHGYLLGWFLNGQFDSTIERWESAKNAYLAHLRDVGADGRAGELDLRPVFASSKIIGVEAIHRAEGWSSLYLLEDSRGGGLGERMIARAVEEKRMIGVHGDCQVEEFYTARGYKRVEERNGVRILMPPTLRDDLIEAATVCLFNPFTRRVLLGRKKTDPWKDFWSCPGGRLKFGETPFAAALREYREETEIDLTGSRPVAESLCYAACGDGGAKGFRIVNYLIPTPGEPEPKPTDEVEARWMPIGEAVGIKPAGVATRAVLRGLAKRLGE